jgi:orotidine-5'-phosphate decarboxylase
MITADKIIVALDTPKRERLDELLRDLKGTGVWVKVGMELFYSFGPNLVNELKEQGFKIFLDLKLHDIPTTVEKALRSLSKLPFDMTNVHAAGGSEMMKRALGAFSEAANPPLLIAVTQLTSTSEGQMRQEQKIETSLLESVLLYSRLCQQAGLQGVVCSPHEVEPIKSLLGKNFLTVTPGIRLISSAQNDQVRFATPRQALELGSDYLVIGRPITQAANPKLALIEMMKG